MISYVCFWGTTACIISSSLLLIFTLFIWKFIPLCWYLVAFLALVVWFDYSFLIMEENPENRFKGNWIKEHSKESIWNICIFLMTCYFVNVGIQQQKALEQTKLSLLTPFSIFLFGLPVIFYAIMLMLSINMLIRL
jgi:energy-coupling factor transporter transmembrane protein EcfT